MSAQCFEITRAMPGHAQACRRLCTRVVSRQMRLSLKHTICIVLKATTVATYPFGPQVLSCEKEQTWIHIVCCDGGNGGTLFSQGSLFSTVYSIPQPATHSNHMTLWTFVIILWLVLIGNGMH